MKTLKFAVLAAVMALAPANSANWNQTVVPTSSGHRIGNPEAQAVLTEYVSYTCSHCATFAREGEPVLELAYISSGKVAFEVQPFIRNALDLTVTMLAQCGAPEKFRLNHKAFMLKQEEWTAPARSASPAQIQRWTQKGAAARRNVANDLGLYDIMEKRGYRITDLDQCLNDDARADALVAGTLSAAQDMGVQGTPSFALNGKLLDAVHSWGALVPVLDRAIGAKPAS